MKILKLNNKELIKQKNLKLESLEIDDFQKYVDKQQKSFDGLNKDLPNSTSELSSRLPDIKQTIQEVDKISEEYTNKKMRSVTPTRDEYDKALDEDITNTMDEDDPDSPLRPR